MSVPPSDRLRQYRSTGRRYDGPFAIEPDLHSKREFEIDKPLNLRAAASPQLFRIYEGEPFKLGDRKPRCRELLNDLPSPLCECHGWPPFTTSPRSRRMTL